VPKTKDQRPKKAIVSWLNMTIHLNSPKLIALKRVRLPCHPTSGNLLPSQPPSQYPRSCIQAAGFKFQDSLLVSSPPKFKQQKKEHPSTMRIHTRRHGSKFTPS
jgi:hypothetical protein